MKKLAKPINKAHLINSVKDNFFKHKGIKPKNLGEITRISGVTPAAVINILRFVNNKKKTNYSKKNKWAI